METMYLIIGAASALIVAIGVFVYSLYYDKVKSTDGENCEYNPNIKDRACCRKIKEIHTGAAK